MKNGPSTTTTTPIVCTNRDECVDTIIAAERQTTPHRLLHTLTVYPIQVAAYHMMGESEVEMHLLPSLESLDAMQILSSTQTLPLLETLLSLQTQLSL